MELGSLASFLGDSSGGWLALAFALGFVHSLDADHVMAVSVLSTQPLGGEANRRSGARQGARAGLRWALGHGAILLAAGLVLLLLGRALPMSLSVWADRGVGIVMVVLGAYVFLDLLGRRGHLHFHEHDGLVAHAHWHTDGDPAHRHDHGAMMVGALHGLAGSAPILAVLPVAARSPLLGLAYLLIFALGVALAMAAVSGLLGHLTGGLSRRRHATGLRALRAFSGAGSMALGLWLAVAA